VLQSSTQIAAIVNIATAYGRHVLRGIGKFSNQHGHWSIVPVPCWEFGVDGGLRDLHGAIVQADRMEIAESLARIGKPVVNVADNHAHSPLPTVRSDHLEIGRLGARHLLDRGFRNLAFCGMHHEFYAQQRAEGFRAAAQGAGYEPIEFWKPDAHVDSVGPESLDPWVATLHGPVGIMACNDWWAWATAHACHRMGLRVPDEAAIIGVDNADMICELSAPQLSSVAVAAQRIGYEAAALLARLLEGQPSPQSPIIIPPIGVVTRKSTDIMAIDDTIVVAAIQFIREHASDPIGVGDVVEHVKASRRRLETHFANVLGRSPAAEIRRIRVERAKHLLETTDVALSTIAFDCGFSDAPRLTKVFSKELGMAPSAYRMRTRLR